MAVTAFIYAKFFISALNKELDLVGATDDAVVSLHTNTYTPNQDTHDYWDDATNEISGTGYSTPGQSLTGETFTSTLNVITWDSTDPSWTTATFTARRAVYYVNTAGATSTDPLICWVDFGADEVVAAGTFTIVQHASGILTITPTDATGFP